VGFSLPGSNALGFRTVAARIDKPREQISTNLLALLEKIQRSAKAQEAGPNLVT